MPRFARAVGAFVVVAVVAAGLAVGLTTPSQAHERTGAGKRLGCVVSVLQATTAPVISGTGAVGSPVGLSQLPTWNCDLVTTSTQWFNSSGAIAGATGSSYTPTADDAGGVVMAVVTDAVLGLLPVSVPSNAIPVPLPGGGGGPGGGGDPGSVLALLGGLGLPGTAEVGQLIVLTDPVWNLPGVTTTYQWLRDGVPIPGADDQFYVPTLDDAGHQLSAQVTGLLAGIPALTVITDALPVPLPGGQSQVAPVSDVAITGAKKIGTTLALTGPTWDPADATSRYQWLRDNAPIPGATTATYALAPADFGHQVSVKVTGHKTGYTDNTITSDPVTPLVGDAISIVMKPRITGTGAVGRLLTADPGQWSGGTEASGPPDYSYQWLRGGAAIPGAVAQTYQVDKADVGQDLAVLVTATRPAYKAGKFTTAPVTVAKLTSKLSAALARKTVTKGKAAMLRLVLRVPSMGSPTGDVTILDKKSTLTQKAFTKGRHGRLVVKLSGLAPGVHKLRAVYAGTATVAGSRSKTVRLVVKR